MRLWSCGASPDDLDPAGRNRGKPSTLPIIAARLDHSVAPAFQARGSHANCDRNRLRRQHMTVRQRASLPEDLDRYSPASSRTPFRSGRRSRPPPQCLFTNCGRARLWLAMDDIPNADPQRVLRERSGRPTASARRGRRRRSRMAGRQLCRFTRLRSARPRPWPTRSSSCRTPSGLHSRAGAAGRHRASLQYHLRNKE